MAGSQTASRGSSFGSGPAGQEGVKSTWVGEVSLAFFIQLLDKKKHGFLLYLSTLKPPYSRLSSLSVLVSVPEISSDFSSGSTYSGNFWKQISGRHTLYQPCNQPSRRVSMLLTHTQGVSVTMRPFLALHGLKTFYSWAGYYRYLCLIHPCYR